MSRSRCNTRTVWTKWNGVAADNVAHAAGASILSLVRVCVVRAACAGPGGLPLGSATHFHNVAIATHPVHPLQVCPLVHN